MAQRAAFPAAIAFSGQQLSQKRWPGGGIAPQTSHWPGSAGILFLSLGLTILLLLFDLGLESIATTQ